MASPLIFLQLNEVNFDVVRHYVGVYDDLPALKRLLSTFHSFETFGEDQYDRLEPWIQWVSAQTGKTYDEHGVYRLGDAAKMPKDIAQIFEVLEERGLRVGAISPMNAANRLKTPAYFVPDPWTDTDSDGSGFARRLTEMLRQTVNDNASGKISVRSLRTLAEAVLRSFNMGLTLEFVRLVAESRKKPWMKSLVLDNLIHLVHRALWLKTKPDVSFVFLNAGAHIQHHYFLNAETASFGVSGNPEWYVPANADPVRDMLKVYDRILGDCFALAQKGGQLILATGLTQVPYDRVKYYYRLSEHASFLRRVGIRFKRVLPRMTRDFEVEFDNQADAERAAEQLRGIRLERTNRALFGEPDIRGASLFATLTYSEEICADDTATMSNGARITHFGTMVSFVAIKNGMHSTRGFVFVSPEVQTPLPREPVSVTYLFGLTKQLATGSV
ncbi:MAG: hypothetical protein KF686_15105 [Ramlibacter sp.]|nr:hypothetical protein [Ramlibacter sp.]